MLSTDLPTWAISLLLAPFGLVIGSFGNVLVHRLPQEDPAHRDVVWTPSACPTCGARIRPWHNVPLWGWLVLGGRCADCGWRIPGRYPLLELFGGLLFAASPWLFPFGSLIWAKGLICGFALLVLFFTDLEQFLLPDAIQFPLMALGLLFTVPQLLWPQSMAWQNGLQPAPSLARVEAPVTLLQSLLGLSLGYGGPWAFERAYVWVRNHLGRAWGLRPLEAAMGMGDFKMLAWLGAFWGWSTMLGILALGACLGVALGLPLATTSLLTKLPRVRRTLRAWGHPTEGAACAWLGRTLSTRLLPFGCFLALATPLAVFLGHALWLALLG